MEIDRSLNLVVTVDRDPGPSLYVHSMPISREVFEANFLVISKTFASIYNQGLGWNIGPRVAGMMLKKIAQDDGVWPEVELSLVNEIRRLSSVSYPDPEGGGWRSMPLYTAVTQGILTADEAAEAENPITFFIVASAMHKKRELQPILQGGLVRVWDAQITSLSSTEFTAGLPTLKETGSTGEKAPPSSIPV